MSTNKILEAARLVTERKKAYDDRAQAIIDGMAGLDSKANQAFERPEGLMASTEGDFKELHKTFDEALALSNSVKNDGDEGATHSETSSTSFPETKATP